MMAYMLKETSGRGTGATIAPRRASAFSPGDRHGRPGGRRILEQDHTAAGAGGTQMAERFKEALRLVLPGHLHQPEVGDLENLGPGLVAGQFLPELLQHGIAVLRG